MAALFDDISDELSSSTAAQIGVMSKLSTGSTALDVLLCVLLPLLLGRAPQAAAWLRNFLERWLVSRRFYYRTIEHVAGDGYYWRYENDTGQNEVLQEAVLLYLESIRPGLAPFCNTGLKLVCNWGFETNPNIEGDGDGDDDDSDADSDDYSYAEYLKRSKICTLPPERDWIEVERGLWMKRLEKDESEKGDKIIRTKIRKTIWLRSDVSEGVDKIDAFINKAYSYYAKTMEERKTNHRHLYTPLFRSSSPSKKKKDEDDDGEAAPADNAMLFKRYKLSDNKTFATFFHPEKEALLQLVDRFMNRTGKFAIPGYPQKLGILLHGPPGTGKTSLIKAIAQYTDRSIVSVPLSRVKTNQELIDLVFDQEYKVEGEERATRLPFRKTIFVMEDIDAASDVVLDRESKAQPDKEAPMLPALAASALTKTQLSRMLEVKDDDKLNLAGLLNVLDGVVDCPERIV
ncbi:unnamed protein product, partial [Ostreobium quekettii]